MRTTFSAALALALLAAGVGGQEAAIRLQPVQSPITDHRAAVYHLRWSPDGRRIATAGGEGWIVVRDVPSGRSRVLAGHRAPVWNVSWSPDGASLASVGLEADVRIWDVASGRETMRLPVPERDVYSVAWSPGGHAIVAGTGGGALYLFDYPGGTLVRKWQAHTGQLASVVVCLAWSPDGRRFASGAIDFNVKVWDAESQRLLATLGAATPARSDVNGLSWSPDGRLLAAACQDGFVRVWDVQKRRMVRGMHHGVGWVRGVSWSPDGQWLAASGESTTISLWNAATGAEVGRLSGHSSPIWALQWSPDGRLLASGSGLYGSPGGDCSLRLWGAVASQGSSAFGHSYRSASIGSRRDALRAG